MKFERVYKKPAALFRLYLCFNLFFCALSCKSDSTTTPEIIPESSRLEELITEIEAGTYGEINSLLILSEQFNSIRLSGRIYFSSS